MSRALPSLASSSGRWPWISLLFPFLCLALLPAAVFGASWKATDYLPYPHYARGVPSLALIDGAVPWIQEILYPVHSLPTLLLPGDELRIIVDVGRDPATTNLEVLALRLRSHRQVLEKVMDLTSVATVAEDGDWGLFLISATLPSTDVPYDLYDLEIELGDGTVTGPLDCAAPPAGGWCDRQPRSVKILDRFRQDFRFIHLSDVHQGDPRGSTKKDHFPQEIADGIVATLNFLQPEFVIISGDLAFGDAYFEEFPAAMETFDRAQFATFNVPGNHDYQHNVLGPLPINDGFEYYRSFFGPPNYSFDYGSLHFVGLNSMDRPKADREIGIDGSGGLATEFWGGIDLSAAGGGGSLAHDQLAWLETDLVKNAADGSKSEIFIYLHHDPTKDYTPNLESHDIWNFDDPEYAESSDRIRQLIAQYGIGWVLVGHDHYDLVHEVLGAKFVQTTTTASERRFDSHWGYRLFDVKGSKVAKFNYGASPNSIPYGYHEDPDDPDQRTPYLSVTFNGGNDGSTGSETAVIKNELQEPMTGRLEFFLWGLGNQASRGEIVQESVLPGGVRVLVEVEAPAQETIQVRVQPDTAFPAAPTGLEATVNEDSIRLRWDPIMDTDLAAYRLVVTPAIRSGDSRADEVIIELPVGDLPDPAHPSHTVTGLTPGSQYNVFLTALDQGGRESGAILAGPLFLHAPPPVPTNFSGVAGDQFIDVRFVPVGRRAVSWRLYYGSGNGGLQGNDATEGASPIDLSSTSFRLSGLSNGQVYGLAISSVDSQAGESDLSPVINVVPNAFPGADLDGDGFATAIDRTVLLRTQAGLAALDGSLKPTSDLNRDGKIDLGDVVLADRLVRGLNTPPLVFVISNPTVLQASVETLFDASSTMDREEVASELEFRFDFEGDGSFSAWSSEPVGRHLYGDDAAPRQVVIQARDGHGGVGQRVLRFLPRVAQRVFLIDIDGSRRDVFYRWISGTAGGHRALRDDILGSISFGGTNLDDASFSGSRALGANFTRALFPTVTFTNQAAIPTGQYARTHGIAGNEFFDRDELFERSFVSGDAQAVYTEGKALATLWAGARTIYQDAGSHGFSSTVIFHQYPKESDGYVSQTIAEFVAFLLDGAEKYDQLTLYRGVEELERMDFPPLSFLYLAGLDHRSHAEGIESQDLHIEVVDGLMDLFVNGGTLQYPDITFPASEAPIDFPGLKNLPDPTTADPNDSIFDNSIFCFTADHGQINYSLDSADIVSINDVTDTIHEYFDPEAVLEGHTETERGPHGLRIRTGLKDSETLDAADIVLEINGVSMFLYVKNRLRGTWKGYPDFDKDVLPLARAFAMANVDGRLDTLPDGSIGDILIRRTAKSGELEYSEGYIGYRWNGQTDELIELEDYFTPEFAKATNIIDHLRGLESRRSGDIILTSGRSLEIADTDLSGTQFSLPFSFLSSAGQHGNITPGESLIPQVCGGPPVERLGLARTEPQSSQIDFAPTAAQFLGINMDEADGTGYLYKFDTAPSGVPQGAVLLGSASTKPGETVTLPVRLLGAKGAAAVRLNMAFDGQTLTLSGASGRQLSGQANLVEIALKKMGSTGQLAALFDELQLPDEAVANIRFAVSRDAAPGTYFIEIDMVEIADSKGTSGKVGGFGGIVQITPPPTVPSRNLPLPLLWAVILAFFLACRPRRAVQEP